jgi:hypothetical protein
VRYTMLVPCSPDGSPSKVRKDMVLGTRAGTKTDNKTPRPKTQDPRPKTQDPRQKTQDTRHKTQDPRPKTQDPRHKTQDTRPKTPRHQDTKTPRPKTQDPRPKNQDPRPKQDSGTGKYFHDTHSRSLEGSNEGRKRIPLERRTEQT